MSSETDWNTSAERERIVNRKKRLKEKHESRAQANPIAFGWSENDAGMYECETCGKEYRKLPGCLRHIANVHGSPREDGQTGIGDWA